VKRRTVQLAALALAAAAIGACESDPWNDPAIGDPFVPEPRMARRVGRLLEDASPALVRGIGGASVGDASRTLWLLGDVQVGYRDEAYTASSALIQGGRLDWPGSDGLDVVVGADPTMVPPPDGMERHWMSGISVVNDADVTLYYAVTRPGPTGEPALDYHGSGVARLIHDGLEIETRDDGDWRFFGRGDPLFGMAVVQADHGVTAGFDYVFGIRGDAGTNRVYVARVPHGEGDDRTAYRFYAQDGTWDENVRLAEPLFRAGARGLSVSWNEHLQAFLAVYSWTVPGDRGEPDKMRVMARASRRPEGPWSRETMLFETRGPKVWGRVRPASGAREHPQLAQDFGRVLFVTLDGGYANNERRRAPRVWRVDLPHRR
jgi:hypothetical protein